MGVRSMKENSGENRALLVSATQTTLGSTKEITVWRRMDICDTQKKSDSNKSNRVHMRNNLYTMKLAYFKCIVNEFGTQVQSCIHHHNQDTEHFQQLKVPRGSFQSRPSFLLQFHATLNLLSVTMVCLLQILILMESYSTTIFNLFSSWHT